MVDGRIMGIAFCVSGICLFLVYRYQLSKKLLGLPSGLVLTFACLCLVGAVYRLCSIYYKEFEYGASVVYLVLFGIVFFWWGAHLFKTVLARSTRDKND